MSQNEFFFEIIDNQNIVAVPLFILGKNENRLAPVVQAFLKTVKQKLLKIN